jgi:acyl carrier protein
MSDVEIILDFLREEVEEDLPDDVELDENTSLFREQLLDSMNLTSLITFLEETFRIKIGAIDIVFENLDSVTDMVAFIARKRAASA